MKICFWGEVYGSLSGNTPGGGELQIALLAKALALGGDEVIILDKHIKEQVTTSEGIRVAPIPGWNSGVRILRSFTSRLYFLYKAMIEADADIYYARIRTFEHIVPLFVARKLNAKFIYATASDLDVLGFMERIKYFYLQNVGLYSWLICGTLTEIIFPFLIKNADCILVQHEMQRKAIEKRVRNVYVFPNLIDIGALDLRSRDRIGFAFVGSIDIRKGLKEMVRIIHLCPDRTFKLIGKPRGRGSHRLYNKLRECTNVRLLGRLPYQEAVKEIGGSKALISTSLMEGFPNVFIEAWITGTPVFSLYVDPGNVITTNRLGVCCNGQIDLLKESIVSEYEHDSSRLANYVLENHSASDARRRFLEILSDAQI